MAVTLVKSYLVDGTGDAAKDRVIHRTDSLFPSVSSNENHLAEMLVVPTVRSQGSSLLQAFSHWVSLT